jgi:hypothetical protein
MHRLWNKKRKDHEEDRCGCQISCLLRVCIAVRAGAIGMCCAPLPQIQKDDSVQSGDLLRGSKQSCAKCKTVPDARECKKFNDSSQKSIGVILHSDRQSCNMQIRARV